MTREQWETTQEAAEAAWFRKAEWQRITRQLEALYGAMRAGDTSVYTRQRIGRLEALQQALCGFPEQLAA
ncbi:hypothetical protein AQJ43_23540 [Streptomyces avermitilis]|nr:MULTISPECIES: hypothetical protein [Streptomyces]KUN52202.1 hypothetical protein AQJ43_23540 [Streptomyces avermitilis]MYT01135.1 hypothetical protein [Streptomyces sp. SID5469]OOV30750.1 hypothetical protein SM007_16235 [Streptomyces avermitilis]BBJ53722.1 hypothetical protein SAVMC3_63510 [Streptomyces avermitilis]GDY65727.1 hypothetical protein SAV14893_051200 [Streptomyces avermitilis]